MDAKQQAQEIATMLIHGWKLWLTNEREGAGPNVEVTSEEIETFLRERAANIAQALPALVEVES